VALPGNGTARLLSIAGVIMSIAITLHVLQQGDVNAARSDASLACQKAEVLGERENNHYAEVSRQLAEIKTLIVQRTR
jgi:hypothetical protein